MHKKHKKRYINILIIPDNEETPRSFKLRTTLLRLLVGSGVLFLIIIIIGAITYGRVLQLALERNSLLEENATLKEQVKKITQLSNELNRLKSYNQKVRNSLQGYVKFAEENNAKDKIQLEDISLEPVSKSVFSSIPTKSPVMGFISQEFKFSIHNGIDIVAPEGTPVLAAGDGTVIYSGWSMNDGYTIIIAHDEGYMTFYKHNLRNLVFTLQRVKQGETIAFLGNSGGKTSGPHLHFEIWKDGKPINPQSMLVDLKY